MAKWSTSFKKLNGCNAFKQLSCLPGPHSVHKEIDFSTCLQFQSSNEADKHLQPRNVRGQRDYSHVEVCDSERYNTSLDLNAVRSVLWQALIQSAQPLRLKRDPLCALATLWVHTPCIKVALITSVIIVVDGEARLNPQASSLQFKWHPKPSVWGCLVTLKWDHPLKRRRRRQIRQLQSFVAVGTTSKIPPATVFVCRLRCRQYG